MRPPIPALLFAALVAAGPAHAQDQSSAIERVETPDGTVTIVRPARRAPATSTAPQGPVDPATATTAPGTGSGRGETRREERRDTLPNAGTYAPDIVIIQQRRGRNALPQQTPTVDPGMGPVPSLRAYEPPQPLPQARRTTPGQRLPADSQTDTIIIRR